MSLFASLLAARAHASITTTHELSRLVWGGYESDAGAVMTIEQALLVDAVYSCTRVLSETLAQLPIILYRRTDNGRERAIDHPLYKLLHLRPNSWQTRFGFIEMQQAHTFLAGNSYSFITRVRGTVREIIPVPSYRVDIDEDDSYRPVYVISWPNGHQSTHSQREVLHTPGLAFDGICGRGFVDYTRHLVGLAREQNRTVGKIAKQGLKLSGVIEHPGRLRDPDVRRHLQESFQAQYSGPDNAGKVVLLEEGLKFNKTALTAEEAQFLESQKFSRSRIAGAARVPPHMIGDLDRSTNNNIEHQALEFVLYSIGPWIVRWEQALNATLLTESEQQELYFEFLTDSLLRGDIRTRTAAYQSGILTGYLTRNEVRLKENLNTLPGLDEPLEPQNMRVAGDPPPDDPQTRKET